MAGEDEFDTLPRFYALAFPSVFQSVTGCAFEIDECECEGVIPDAKPNKDRAILLEKLVAVELDVGPVACRGGDRLDTIYPF